MVSISDPPKGWALGLLLGWGLLVLQMLANLWILFHLTGNKTLLEGNCQIHSSCWKVVCPCEIWEVKGLCGEKKSLAAWNVVTEGLMSLGAILQHVAMLSFVT